jgi:hypothetical protein
MLKSVAYNKYMSKPKIMNFSTQNLRKISFYFIASSLILPFFSIANDVNEVEYVWPIDEDNVIPLPFVSLRGKLIRHTFPGPPNYENIKEGDCPETRWVLEIFEEEIQKLVNSNYVPKDIYLTFLSRKNNFGFSKQID